MYDMYIRLDTAAQAVTLGGVSFAAFYACAKTVYPQHAAAEERLCWRALLQKL